MSKTSTWDFHPDCVCGGTFDTPNVECERCRFVIALKESRKQRVEHGKAEVWFQLGADYENLREIAANNHRVLNEWLNNPPMDEAGFAVLSFKAEDQADLVSLIELANDAQVKWAIGLEFKNPAISAWLVTCDLYRNRSDPHAQVTIEQRK